MWFRGEGGDEEADGGKEQSDRNNHANERKNNVLIVCSDAVVNTVAVRKEVSYCLILMRKQHHDRGLHSKLVGSGTLEHFVPVNKMVSIEAIGSSVLTVMLHHHSAVEANGLVFTLFSMEALS